MSGQDDRLLRRVVEAAARAPAAGPCPDAEVLGLYAERMLDDDEREALDGHVAACPRCQEAVAALVRGAPEAGVEAAAGPTTAGSGAGVVPAPWWSGWRWLAPAATLAAMAVVAVWVSRPAQPELTMTSAEPERPAAARPGAELADAQSPPPALPESPPPAAPVDAPLAARRSAPGGGTPAAAAARQEAVVPAAPAAETRERSAAGLRDVERRVDSAGAASQRLARAEPDAPAVAAGAAPAPPPTASPVAPAPVGAVAADTAGAPARESASNAGTAKALQETAGVAGRTGQGQARATATLSGRVTSRARRALPDGAVIAVRLLDVSRPDAASVELGRAEIVTRGGQMPVPFVVRYDPAAVDAGRRYAVQVTVAIDGEIRFRTVSAQPVLTAGAPATSVEVVVDPVQ